MEQSEINHKIYMFEVIKEIKERMETIRITQDINNKLISLKNDQVEFYNEKNVTAYKNFMSRLKYKQDTVGEIICNLKVDVRKLSKIQHIEIKIWRIWKGVQEMWKTKWEGLNWMWVTERNIRNNVKEAIVE